MFSLLLFFDFLFDVSDIHLWEALDDHLIKEDNFNFIEPFINVFGLLRGHLIFLINPVSQGFSLFLDETVILYLVPLEDVHFLAIRVLILENCQDHVDVETGLNGVDVPWD
jgi:hypothetical protein